VTNPAEVLEYLASQPRDPEKGDWRLAKVRDTFLGYEDHGILTASLQLDYGGASQGAGMYDLRTENEMFRFVDGFLQACGVNEWSKLKGRTIFALVEDGLVRGLKPLPMEGGKVFWFKKE
jgi:hypothetical protein